MKIAAACLVIGLVLVAAPARAHMIGDPEHDLALSGSPSPTSRWAVDEMVLRDRVRPVSLAQAAPARTSAPVASLVQLFQPFGPAVRARTDDHYLYVESDALPNHRMMVGITAWQQQVPLPQPYVGENAWRIPLRPVPAATTRSAKTGFFRGAIALAVNGVPIFNPIKNDGRTDTFLAGELDEFGGHAGRADDYHYHIAPLHLQKTVGEGKPIALALDGYPIYGLTEADGSPVRQLDALNGHTYQGGAYHYHSSKTYPYINGGFYGEITERGGQVDPQPRTPEIRPAQRPLRGAKVTSFTTEAPGSYTLQFQLTGETWSVKYSIQPDGTFKFRHLDPQGLFEDFTYRRSNRR